MKRKTLDYLLAALVFSFGIGIVTHSHFTNPLRNRKDTPVQVVVEQREDSQRETWLEESMERMERWNEENKVFCLEPLPIPSANRENLPSLEECLENDMEFLSFINKSFESDFVKNALSPRGSFTFHPSQKNETLPSGSTVHSERYTFTLDRNTVRLEYYIKWSHEGNCEEKMLDSLNYPKERTYVISAPGGQFSRVQGLMYKSRETTKYYLKRQFIVGHDFSLSCSADSNFERQDPTLQLELQAILYRGFAEFADRLPVEVTEEAGTIFREKTTPLDYLATLEDPITRVIKVLDSVGDEEIGSYNRQFNFYDEASRVEYEIHLHNAFGAWYAPLELNERLLKGCHASVTERSVLGIGGDGEKIYGAKNFATMDNFLTKEIGCAFFEDPFMFYSGLDTGELAEMNDLAQEKGSSVVFRSYPADETVARDLIDRGFSALLRLYDRK